LAALFKEVDFGESWEPIEDLPFESDNMEK